MSLVNEMLNELEKEKSKGGNLDGLVAVSNKNGQPFWFKATVIFVFLVLIFVTVWHLSKTSTTATNNNKLSNAKTVIVANQADIKADSNPATTRLVESEKVEYQVEESKSEPSQTNRIAESNLNTVGQKNSHPISAKFIEEERKLAVKPTSNKFSDSQSADSNNSSKNTEITQKKQKAVALQHSANKQSNEITSKPNNKAMIKVSRKSLAEKELRLITNQWNLRSATENNKLLDQFLLEFSDLDSAWLGAINLIEDKDIGYHQRLLEKALDNFPGQPAFRMIVVKQQISQNNFAEALSELKKIDGKLWQQSQFKIAGYLAQKLNDHISAIKFYNQLLKNKPNQGDINMAIAISLEALNENSLAVAKFQRALEDSSLKPIQRQFIAQRIAVLKG